MIASMTSPSERIGKLDIGIAALASAVAVADVISQVGDPQYGDVSAWSVAPILLITVPLLWRRKAPLTALAATLAGVLAHWAIFGGVVRCGFTIPIMGLLAFSAGARLSGTDRWIALGLAQAIGIAVCLTDGPSGAPPSGMVITIPIVFAAWGLGLLVRSRARMVEQLDARTGELRSARDENARLQVADERARLSAELDSLLQRRLGELAALAESDAEDKGAQLAEIERRSRRTLEDMRAMVGVLRDDETAPLAPQPTLTHLDALLARSAGADARLTVEGRPRVLPAAVELSAYRIVEQLLDALAGAPDVEVRVRFADDALDLIVSGQAGPAGAAPFERARERVALHAGTLRTTAARGRAEAVVSLPSLVAA
jgi:signal transduction histidine kinase